VPRVSATASVPADDMKHELLLFSLLVATPSAFAASPPETSPPAAAPQLSPVTVSGSKATEPLRFDARAGCPAIDAALQKWLSSAWVRLQ
jgi:hypothetical protein